jgi:hypothetical protein
VEITKFNALSDKEFLNEVAIAFQIENEKQINDIGI